MTSSCCLQDCLDLEVLLVIIFFSAGNFFALLRASTCQACQATTLRSLSSLLAVASRRSFSSRGVMSQKASGEKPQLTKSTKISSQLHSLPSG